MLADQTIPTSSPTMDKKIKLHYSIFFPIINHVKIILTFFLHNINHWHVYSTSNNSKKCKKNINCFLLAILWQKGQAPDEQGLDE